MAKKVVVIDGQGGKIGKIIIEALKNSRNSCEITAIGTNSIATAAMLKAGADCGATGENPVVVACRDADVIIGPVGIAMADSLLGEVTPEMAAAIGRSSAVKLLIPVNKCKNVILGTETISLSDLPELLSETLPKYI